MLPAAYTSIVRREQSSARPEAGPFLSVPNVQRDEWIALTQGQRDLHTFWTKLFVPLFADYDRVQPKDLPGRERNCICHLLNEIALGTVPFDSRLSYVTTRGTRVDVTRAETRVGREPITIQVIAETLEEGTQGLQQRLSLEAYGPSTDFEFLLTWRPQANPMRGSVLLQPRALWSKRRFAIAAFNANQFKGICIAFLDYVTLKSTARKVSGHTSAS